MAAASRSVRIAVPGGYLFAEITGNGPPLVLIHGWPLDHRLFARQVGPLSEPLTVIAYDRRGFGRSSAPADLGLEPGDIDRLLDELGFESAHLLGMSQGGRIALRYAATRQDRVRSLILQGAAVDGLSVDENEEERIPVGEFAALAKSGRLDEVKRRWLEHPMMRLPAGDAEAHRLVRSILGDYDGSDLLALPNENNRFPVDVIDRMAAFERPVLVVTGAQETESRRAQASQLLAAVPCGREVELTASGHLANLTEPDDYNRAVRDFVLAAEHA